jgi:4-amino-4-deoxy-L-arabinose transferase-like glycosyltransferase
VLATLLVIVLVAWGIRLYHLGWSSLWVDEGFSFSVGNGGIQSILTTLPREDRHPPLHYLLLWLTMRAFGSSEFSLRLLSAAAGLVGVPLIYRIGRSLGGRRVGLLAALALAASPFDLWYSQEARMYALLAALGLASIWFWLRWLARPTAFTLMAFVIAATAALYTHYYAVFLWPVYLAAWLLLGDGQRWSRVLGAMAAGVVLFVPWLLAVWQQYLREPHGYLLPVPLGATLAGLASTYTLGEAGGPTLIVVAAVILALAGTLPGGNRVKDGRLARADRWGGVLLLVWVLAAPIGAYLVSTITSVDVRATGRMYYLAGLPAFLVLVARGLNWLNLVGVNFVARLTEWAKPRTSLSSIWAMAPAVTLGGALILAAELPALSQQFQRGKEDFRTAAGYVQQHERAGDVIVLDAEYIFRPFAYYYHGTVAWHRSVVEAGQVDADLSQQVVGRQRVWLVLSHDNDADPHERVMTWLDQHATPLDEQWLDGIRLRLYGVGYRSSTTKLPVEHAVGVSLGDQVEVVGANLPAQATGGQIAPVAVIWHVLARLAENDHVALLLTDAGGQVWWQTDHVPISPFYSPTSWTIGEYLRDDYELAVPLGLPAGQYAVQVQFYRPSDGQPLRAETGAGLIPLGKLQITPSFPGQALPGRELTPGLRLVRASLSSPIARPGDELTATLLWQVSGAPRSGQPLEIRIIGPGGAVLVDRQVAAGAGPAGSPDGQIGEVVLDREKLTVPGRAPPGYYSVGIGTTNWQDLGGFNVTAMERKFTTPPIQFGQTAVFGQPGDNWAIALLGYDLAPTSATPGQAVHLRVYWQARGESPTDFTVFTHLIGPDGKVHGQRDNPPVGGTRPTSSWLTDEVIVDDYDLPLDPHAAAGTYSVEIGLYRPDTGVRLPVGNQTAVVLGERVTVGRGN